MKTIGNKKPLKKTFADKFSKFKTKFLIVFWLMILIIIGKLLLPIFLTLYSITNFNESYFKIDVIDKHAHYTRTTEIPIDWIPISKISKRVQQAIISSEDGKFYSHPGYDLDQLKDVINNLKVSKGNKKKVRGASTITQQLVKNLYLTREKSFSRKGSELIMSIMVEKYAEKNKILEAYLNIIEYGKDIYGIQKASLYYFKKEPSKLNARESAFLAMLLPSPIKYSKSFKNKSLTPFALRIVESILLKMRQSGYISEEEYINQLNSRFSWEKKSDSKMIDIEEEEESINEVDGEEI